MKLFGTNAPVATSLGATRGELWGITATVNWASGSPSVTLSTAVKQGASGVVLEGIGLTARTTAILASGTSVTTNVTLGGSSFGTPDYLPGDAIIGAMTHEANSTPTAESGSEAGGTWSAGAGNNTTGGGSAANIGGIIQVLFPTVNTSNVIYGPQSSGDWSSGVIALRPVAPTSVTNVTATQYGPRSIVVSWDGGGGADSYTIERSLNGTTGWSTVKSGHIPLSNFATWANKKIFIDHSGDPGTTYYYRVTAVNTAGSSAVSSNANATTTSSHVSWYNKLEGTDGTQFTGSNSSAGDNLGISSAGTPVRNFTTTNKKDGNTGLILQSTTVSASDRAWWSPSGWTASEPYRRYFFRSFVTYGSSSPGAVVMLGSGYNGTNSDTIWLQQTNGTTYQIQTSWGTTVNALTGFSLTSMHRVEADVAWDGGQWQVEVRIYSNPDGTSMTAQILGPFTPPSVQQNIFDNTAFGFDPRTSILATRTAYHDEPRWSTDTWIGTNDLVPVTPITASDTLSASVTDTSTAPAITGQTKTASDTLSASVTESTNIVPTTVFLNVSASDTLTVTLTNTISDNFNRANGAIGSNWEISGVVAPTISGNELTYTGSSAATLARYVGNYGNNPSASFVFRGATGTSTGVGPAVLVPAYNATPASMNDYYYLSVGPTALSIRRKNNLSAATTLLGANVSMTPVVGDTYELRVEGTDLVGYINGVENIRRAMSLAPLTAGGTGVGLFFQPNGLTGAVLGADTFSATFSEATSITGTSSLPGSDTLSASVTETVQTRVSVTASDTLSASVTDSGTFATISVTASDTLSASVDDTSSLSGNVSSEPIVGSDTLSVSVGDSASVIVTNTNVPGSDALNASVTETVTTLVSLSTSDTLNANVAEQVSFPTFSISASDTLSASVSETTSIAAPPVAIIGSDTLSVSLDDASQVDPSDVIITPDTTVATFHFTADSQGFIAVTAPNTTATAPGGYVQMTRSGKSNAASQSYWELTTTWGALGVAPGGTVASVTMTSALNRVFQYNNGTGVVVGPYQIHSAAGAVVGSLWTGRSATATDTGTTIAAQDPVQILTANAATDTVKFRLYNTIGTTSQGNPSVSIQDDQVELTIAYYPPTDIINGDDLFVTVSDVASPPVITGLAKFGSDSLNVAVTDTATAPVIKTQLITASDALSASLTDVSNPPVILFQAKTGTETLSVSLADTSVLLPKVATADALNVSLSDTSRISLGGTNWPMYNADFIYNTNQEYNGGGLVLKTASDLLQASVTEGWVFGAIPRAAADTLSVSVTETIQFATIQRSASDGLVASVTDEGNLGNLGIIASDLLSVNLVEALVFNQTPVVTLDDLNASVTETRSFGTVTVSAADTLTATLSSEGVGGTRYFSSADTLTGRVSETTQRLINGNVIITTQDALNVQVTETTAFGNIPVTAADTLSASITETTLPKLIKTASDTLSAAVTETTLIALVRYGTDILTVSLSDIGSREKSNKYKVYVWDGTQWDLRIAYIWNGSAWVEAQLYKWNGASWV